MKKNSCDSLDTQKQGFRSGSLRPITPETLHGIAEVLRSEGCSEMEIHAALLAMCGVPLQEIRLSPFRAF